MSEETTRELQIVVHLNSVCLPVSIPSMRALRSLSRATTTQTHMGTCVGLSWKPLGGRRAKTQVRVIGTKVDAIETEGRRNRNQGGSDRNQMEDRNECLEGDVTSLKNDYGNLHNE